jgi:hypothetical protein
MSALLSLCGNHNLTCGIRPLLRARWNLAVAEELAAPCYMEFVSVRDLKGNVLDFQWRFVDPHATFALGCVGAHLVGQRLLRVLTPVLGDALFDTYRLAIRRERPQAIRMRVGQWRGYASRLSGSRGRDGRRDQFFGG